jgi:topoisomerase IA-like protein
VFKHSLSPFQCSDDMRTPYVGKGENAYPIRTCDILHSVNRKELTKYFAKFGRQGGKARAARLTPEQRKASARKAAQARWAKQKGKFSRDTET